jgi:peptide deformylase
MKENILKIEGIHKNSLGLSANQIGYDKRIILISKYPTLKLMRKFFDAIINPEILEYSEDKTLKWEACLSFPE